MEERPNRIVPQRMGDVVSQLMARRGYGRILAENQYADVWQEIVGDEIARASRVGPLKRSVLEILVQNSVLLQELTFRKSEILNKLRGRFADHRLADLKFRVDPLS